MAINQKIRQYLREKEKKDEEAIQERETENVSFILFLFVVDYIMANEIKTNKQRADEFRPHTHTVGVE